MTRLARSAALLVILLCASACTKHAAATMPIDILPYVSVEPGRAGYTGRVVFDVEQGPSVVSVAAPATTHAGAAPSAWREVCTTPCSAELPLGVHRFRFMPPREGILPSVAQVEVGEGASIYRQALSEEQSSRLGMVTGGVLLGSGALLGVSGLLVAATCHEGDPCDANATPLGIVSVVALVAGAVLLVVSKTSWSEPRAVHHSLAAERELLRRRSRPIAE